MKTGHAETGNCEELIEKYAGARTTVLDQWEATRPELVACFRGCCNCDLCVKAKGKKNICNCCAVRLKEAHKK